MTLPKEALAQLLILVTVTAVSNQRSLAEVRSQNQVFPGSTWQTTTPDAEGMDPLLLNKATDHLKQHSGSDGVSQLLIIRNGKVVWAGKDVAVVHGIWSGTKSFTSTCLGLLIADGRCSLETRAAQFLPEMATAYPHLTLRHFTTMTSGYRAQGDEPRGSYTHGPSRTPFIPSMPGHKLLNKGVSWP